MLWMPKNMSQNQKTHVLFNEVGNKLNKKKGLQYFFATHQNHSSSKSMSPYFMQIRHNFIIQFHKLLWCRQFSLSMSQTGMTGKYLQCPLTLLRQCPLKCHFVFKRKLLVLGASLFEYVRTKRMIFKYHIEICCKNNQEEVRHL